VNPYSEIKCPQALDQPAFNRKRLKAEKLIDSKVLEQLTRVQVDAGCFRPRARRGRSAIEVDVFRRRRLDSRGRRHRPQVLFLFRQFQPGRAAPFGTSPPASDVHTQVSLFLNRQRHGERFREYRHGNGLRQFLRDGIIPLCRHSRLGQRIKGEIEPVHLRLEASAIAERSALPTRLMAPT
jgi:hypothetical protein